MEVMSAPRLNYQTTNYVSKDFNEMAHNMGKSVPSIFDVQIGKEDLVLPQHVVHNIEIIVNDNPATATSLSDVTTGLPNNNLEPSNATASIENIVPIQLLPAPSPLVLPDNTDNQHLTNSLPTSNEFKFKLPNNPVVASLKTPLLARNLNVPFKEENGEPPKKKFKGVCNNDAPKSIISPIRYISNSKKRKRMARNKILSLKFRNDSPPDYILSFIWKYWPEMIIANPHQDLSKRFLNKGVFDDNSFNTNNFHSNNIDCAAPYDEVLQVLAAEKYALQSKIIASEHFFTDSQYNDSVYQYQCLGVQQSKVYNAIRQVVKLYDSFKRPYCNFDARFISHHRFIQATSVFPIIKSYEHFYGQA